MAQRKVFKQKQCKEQTALKKGKMDKMVKGELTN